MSKPSQFVAVPERMESAGACIWWMLHGTVVAQEIQAALAEQGFAADEMPEGPSPEAALKRALDTQRDRRRLVRPLKGGSLCLVQETLLEDLHEDEEVRLSNAQLKHRVLANVSLSKIGVPEVVVIDPSEETRGLTKQITDEYWKALDVLTPTDFSSWLVHRAHALNSISLRDNGGMYFIPPWAIPEWHRVVTAVEKTSKHSMLEMPVMRSEEAVKAILATITAEAEAEVQGMETELSEGELGGRALQTRVERCQRVATKVGEYERLLELKLPDIQAALTNLKSRLTAAQLAASAE